MLGQHGDDGCPLCPFGFTALQRTREAWERAYERQAGTKAERALTLVSDDREVGPDTRVSWLRCEARG